eukprot:GGOE01033539.1.p1 GENE.GGOE01033539.1~~GGOE01033539.1.p1  ORF type:complete len:393 (-),score=111.35 GGOE01033539.1:1074-2252(-)
MKVEELQLSQKSSVSEVERIEDALDILVRRLAEYKSYMPAGLFQKQQEEGMPTEETPRSVTSLKEAGRYTPHSLASPHNRKASSTRSRSTVGRRGTTAQTPVAVVRLVRRNVAVMAVNIARFQGEIGQRSANHLEGTLNRLISTVHRSASKAQGNIDAIVGDQVLVTFNAHFACSDPPITASHVALELLASFQEEPLHSLIVQVGLATGPMYSGHLGNAQFKAMVALGAPMKVASLLAHFSGFEEHVVLVCPAVAERIKYHFTIQPVDLISLPTLGEHVPLFAKSVSIFSLVAHATSGRGTQEWLYEVNASGSGGQWTTTFNQVAKANSLEKAKGDLESYSKDHPEDRLALRLLRRLPFWQPQVGIRFAERPDVPQDALLHSLPSMSIENVN